MNRCGGVLGDTGRGGGGEVRVNGVEVVRVGCVTIGGGVGGEWCDNGCCVDWGVVRQFAWFGLGGWETIGVVWVGELGDNWSCLGWGVG